MKMNFMPGLLLLAATTALAVPPEAIQRLTLDERVVVTVPVSTNRVTTISFPLPIAAIDAVGVTADGKTPGQFQLAHTKGSSLVSVRALARKAATNLNVRWNKRTYVFELVESDAPVLALNLEDRAASEVVQPAPQVTPTRLLALLDKAKAFPLLKKQQPEAVAGAEARTFGDEPQITDFNDYEIRIQEVFRFNPEDTLVFHVTLRNKSEHPIRYLPESFCVRVGKSVLSPVHQRRAGPAAAACSKHGLFRHHGHAGRRAQRTFAEERVQRAGESVAFFAAERRDNTIRTTTASALAPTGGRNDSRARGPRPRDAPAGD
jgi:hypothetical protein